MPRPLTPPLPSGFSLPLGLSLTQQMLCRGLKAAGHSYEEAEDGLEAVRLVTAATGGGAGPKRFDAVLMDFVM